MINGQENILFYPCMTYNVDEHQSDNHFNCPLVAYYPENIAANMEFEDKLFLYPYISLDDENSFAKTMKKNVGGS